MSSAPTHILFECATGAAIFECIQTEEVGNKTKQVQESIKDLNSFGRMVKLVSFSPFKNALEALQSCMDVSEGALRWLDGGDKMLRAFLSQASSMNISNLSSASTSTQPERKPRASRLVYRNGA